jgi:hypothetical protein
MDEKYIEFLYGNLGGEQRFGPYDVFKQGISTDESYRRAFYDQIGESQLGNYATFEEGVKKKDGGNVLPTASGDLTSVTSAGLSGLLGSKERGPVNFSEALTPAAHLNRRQQAEFARAGGYVMAPEKSRQLAAALYEKPVSEADRDVDRLIDIVGEDFQKKQDTQKWAAENLVQLQGGIYTPDDAAKQSAQYAATAIAQGGYGNAIQFVNDAIQNNDFGTLRQVVNNYYGSQQAAIKKQAVAPGTNQALEAREAEVARRMPNFRDLSESEIHQQYANLRQQDYTNVEATEKQMAPLKQEQARTNQLLDRLSSKMYAFSNPDVLDAYDQEMLGDGTKPLKNEISANQYSALRYYKDNEPQLFSQLNMELSKAADPELFGKKTYDKNNAEYKYMQYILDKKGSELNAMAIDLQLQQVAPQKAQIDQQFRSKLADLQQALDSSVTYDQRRAIQQQINLTRTQYDMDPVKLQIDQLLTDAKQADVNFNEKYPDYASRAREQMAKDFLQNDGRAWYAELLPRVKWLAQNTVSALENITGLGELEVGKSRSYLFNRRMAEKQDFETYQPSESAAVQSLYRLNLNQQDFQVMNDIRNSDMDREEQLKAAADYLDANRSRIGYIENPQAGKRNWTWGAIGNQVADVSTQVIYQGALTYMTAGAARGLLGAGELAAVETGAVAGTETAAAAEAVLGPAPATVAEIYGTVNSLKGKLVNLGSVFGSTYATAYQPAYQSALQAGKTTDEAEAYANQIAIVNALSETISPDIEVLKRSASGVRGLAQQITSGTLNTGQILGRGAKAFGRGYVQNVVPETLEEVAAAYGEYGVDALHNMNQDDMNSLSNRTQNAIITTVIGMTPLGAFSGAQSVRNQSRMVREQFYQAGLYPDLIRSEVNSMLDNNQISQEEANRRIGIINTMNRIIQDIPTRRDGSEMSDNAKVDYAFSRLKAALASNALETTSDPNAQADLQAQIEQETASQSAILDVVEEPVQPVSEPAPLATGETNLHPTVAPIYQSGDVLVNEQLGNFEIVSVADGVYNIRQPDGNTADYTESEIRDLIEPTRVDRQATEEQVTQAEQGISPTAETVSEEVPLLYIDPQTNAPLPQTTSPSTETITAQTEISPSETTNISPTSEISPAQTENAPGITVIEPTETITPAAETVAPGVTVINPVETAASAETAPDISSQLNIPENATDQREVQEGVLGERTPGNESGQTAETGSSDSLQRETQSGEEGPQAVNENAGLSMAEQEAIGEMSNEDLYNRILDIDPDSPIRGRLPSYSNEELQTIYKGTLSDYSRGNLSGNNTGQNAQNEGIQPNQDNSSGNNTGQNAQNEEAQPNWATAAPVRAVTRAYNAARDAVDTARRARDKVKNKNSTEYQDRQRDYDAAVANRDMAENAYLDALKRQNDALREAGRNAFGISPEGQARADARVIANYIEMAKIYARKGVRTLADFANGLGEEINDFMRRAWEITAGNNAPVQEPGESYREYLKRLRAWEQTERGKSTTRPERTAIRELAATLRTGAKNLAAGVKLLGTDINITREAFNEQLALPANDFLTYVAAMSEVIASNQEQRRNAREILDTLREAYPIQTINAEMNIARQLLAAEERGRQKGQKQASQNLTAEQRAAERSKAREAVKRVRARVESILDGMQRSGLLRSGNFSENDLVDLGKLINNINTERQINDLNHMFQRLVTNSSEAATLQTVKSLQGKLASLIRRSDLLPANMRRKNGVIGNKSVLRALKNLNAMDVTLPLRYAGIMENVIDALNDTGPLNYTNEQIQDFILQQQGMQAVNDANDLKSRYEQVLNILESIDPGYNPDAVVSQDQFNALVDGIISDPDLTAENRLKELSNLYSAVVAYENEVRDFGIDPTTGIPSADLNEIYEQIRRPGQRTVNQKVREALAEAVQDDQWIMSHGINFPATEEQKTWFDQIAKLDPYRLQPAQLALLKNVISNIFVNQDFSGAQYFSAVYDSQQRVDKFTAWSQSQNENFKIDQFGTEGLLLPIIGRYGENISSSDQIILTMANNSRDYAVNLMDVTSLGDIKADHARAQQIIDAEITAPLRELRKKYKSSGIRSAESTYKRGMYAYLNENNYGQPAEQQAEFERRKNLVAQDIAIKEQLGEDGDKQVGEEAAILRKIFEDNFAGLQNREAMQQADILNEGEQAVYDLFRNFYDTHKDAFREVMETLLNQPFHDVQNYVRDSYRILETGLSDADFRDIDQSNFYTERDQAAPSTATMQRNTFNDLENIAIRDLEGNVTSRRGINYNFDLAQLNNTRGMMEDIHSLRSRIMAKMALNDPALRSTLGATNQRRLQTTIKQQVQQSLGLYSHPEQGEVEKWAGRAAQTLNRIGVNLTLFSLGQIPKQFGDILINTGVNLGTDGLMFFKAWGRYASKKTRQHIDALLAQSEIGVRGKTLAGTNWITPTAQSQLEQLITDMGVDAEIREAPLLARATIEWADTAGARMAWVAYYAQSLKRQGLINDFGEVNWEKESKDINKQARDYAQLMTSTRLNVNSRESQSQFYSKFVGWSRLTQVLFLPLSTFSMNNFSTMYRDINTLFRENDGDQKKVAVRSIVSRMAAELGYQAMRAGLSMLIKQGARAALEAVGVEPPPNRKTEFWKNILSESAKNMMFGMLGNFSTDAIVTGINYLTDKAFDKKIIQTYDQNPNSPANNFGMWSITSNSVQNMYNYTRDMVGRTDPDGNPVDIDNGQRAVLATAFLMNLMAMRGMMIGEAKQIADKAAHTIDQNISKKAKDPFWILMNDPNAKPKISINGKDIDWETTDPAVLQYFKEQKTYYSNELKNIEGWTDQYKATQATQRAKIDMENKYGEVLKYKEEKKKDK